MKIKNIVLAVIGSIAMLASVAANAVPQDGEDRKAGPMSAKGAMMKAGVQQLNLSEEQKADVKNLLKESKMQSEAPLQSLIDAKRALSELSVANDYSQEQVEALSKKIGEAAAQITLIKANSQHEFYAQLTAEQQAKYKEMQAKATDKKNLSRADAGIMGADNIDGNHMPLSEPHEKLAPPPPIGEVNEVAGTI